MAMVMGTGYDDMIAVVDGWKRFGGLNASVAPPAT